MAAEEKEEKEEKEGKEGAEGEGGEGTKGKKSKAKLFIIIGAAVAVIGVAAGFFLFSGSGQPPEGEEAAQPEDAEQEDVGRVELKPFIVNLSSSTSYLKIILVLEYNPVVVEKAAKGAVIEGGKEGGGEGGTAAKALPGVLGVREANINDAIIRVLSSKTAEVVLSADGKEQMKEELVEAINDATGLDEGAVINVYFNDFIIQ